MQNLETLQPLMLPLGVLVRGTATVIFYFRSKTSERAKNVVYLFKNNDSPNTPEDNIQLNEFCQEKLIHIKVVGFFLYSNISRPILKTMANFVKSVLMLPHLRYLEL